MSEPESDDVCRRCDKTYSEHIGFACPVGGTSFRGHDMTEWLEAQLIAAQSSNQKLTEDLERERQGNDSIKAQVDGLRAELEQWKEKKRPQPWTPEHTKSVVDGQAKEIDRLHAVIATDRAQVATLTVERNEWECSAKLYHSELRDLAAGEKVETNLAFPVEKIIRELRTQNAELMAENEAFTQERNAFIDFCNTLPHEGRTGCVGPIAVAKWHIESLQKAFTEQWEKDTAEMVRGNEINAALLADCVVLRRTLGIIASFGTGQEAAPDTCSAVAHATFALATPLPGAPMIEAVRRAVEALRKITMAFPNIEEMDSALAELEKFIP